MLCVARAEDQAVLGGRGGGDRVSGPQAVRQDMFFDIDGDAVLGVLAQRQGGEEAAPLHPDEHV